MRKIHAVNKLYQTICASAMALALMASVSTFASSGRDQVNGTSAQQPTPTVSPTPVQ